MEKKWSGMQCCIVFDIGTTAVKAMLFDRDFVQRGCAVSEYELLDVGDGRLEVSPDTYWDAMVVCAKKLREETGALFGSVEFVTVTTQGETLVLVDEKGIPLRNAIVWLDKRAVEEASEVRAVVDGETFYRTTGIPVCTQTVPLCKLMWVKKNEPEIYNRAKYCLLLGDYIISCLTGIYGTEKTLMSTSGYYDIRKDCLWEELLKKCGINPAKIPRLWETGQQVGTLRERAAAQLGLTSAARVYLSAMDQIACAVGAGNIKEGILTENTGTCLILAVTSGDGSVKAGEHISIYRHAVPGKYLVMTNSLTAGIILKWFKDEFCVRDTEIAAKKGMSVYDYLGELADGAEPMSRGLILLPHFSGILQPECKENARGVFFGMTLDTKKPQFIRSIMEGVGFVLRENLEYLEESRKQKTAEIRSLGGASKSNVWESVKANILGRNLVRMREGECTALGAAIIASVREGWYGSLEEAVFRGNHIADTIPCEERNRAVYEQGYRRYLKLNQCVKSMF